MDGATAKYGGVAAPVAASIDSNRTDQEGVGLVWKGRWGLWKQNGVHVIATCVGVLEVLHTNSAGVAEALDAARPEVECALEAELPDGITLVMVHWVPSASPDAHRSLRVAIFGEMAMCQELQKKWKYRVCCSGLVTVNWNHTFDTASAEHCEKVARELRREPAREHGLRLELPPRWLAEEVQYRCTQIVPTDHWWQFSVLFGEVVNALLIGSINGPTGTVHLLVQFKEPQGALSMCEALTDRYMYNPVNDSIDDCHQVTCAIGNFDRLFEALTRELRQGDIVPNAVGAGISVGGPGGTGAAVPGADDAREAPFVLRRCGRAEIQGLHSQPPDLVPITPGRRRLVAGREELCDIVVHHAHVSKAHATLALQEAFFRPGWLLMLQDSSANGTWVNGFKLTKSHFVQLLPGYRISFLMPMDSLEDDPLTYEVTLGASMKEEGDVSGGIVGHISTSLQEVGDVGGDIVANISTSLQATAPPAWDALGDGEGGACSTTADPSRQQQQHPPPDGGWACLGSADAPVPSDDVAGDCFTNGHERKQVHEHERSAERDRERNHDRHRSRRRGHSRRDHDRSRARTRRRSRSRDRDRDRSRARTRWRSRSRDRDRDRDRHRLRKGYHERASSRVRSGEIRRPWQITGHGGGGGFGGGGSWGLPAVAAGGEGPPHSGPAGTERLGEWLASIDGGCLLPYLTKLEENFETVSQLCMLYRDNVESFFEDFREVQPEDHRQAFRKALLARTAGGLAICDAGGLAICDAAGQTP